MAINGVPATEFSVESLEDKPWRKPGADITDYFNYGFNEITWQAYCERQRRLRMESGAGVPASLGLGPPPKVNNFEHIYFWWLTRKTIPDYTCSSAVNSYCCCQRKLKICRISGS